MARAVKSEIKEMANSSLVSALRTDIWDAYKLKWALNRFVENSAKELTGPNYDTAREVASQYIPILEKRIETAKYLASSIEQACEYMASYMGRFKTLDDAERVKYEADLRNARSNLTALDSISWTDEDFNLISYWHTYFSSKRIINECNDYLEKLDGLALADATAYGMITGEFVPIEITNRDGSNKKSSNYSYTGGGGNRGGTTTTTESSNGNDGDGTMNQVITTPNTTPTDQEISSITEPSVEEENITGITGDTLENEVSGNTGSTEDIITGNNGGGQSFGTIGDGSSFTENNSAGENILSEETEGEIIIDENGEERENSLAEGVYTIPTTVESSSTNNGEVGVNPAPILAGLGLAAAAGVGTKVYLDSKKNNDNEDDADEFIDDEEFEDKFVDEDDFEDEFDLPENDFIAEQWIEDVELQTPVDSEEEVDYERPNFYSDTMSE